MELFDRLRTKRKTIADAEGVSPFVVFWDKTLKEMATYFPQTEGEFKQIYGVGQLKVKNTPMIFYQLSARIVNNPK